MKPSLVVFNQSKGPVTLSLKPNISESSIKNLAQHHSRRVIRSSAISLTIPCNCSVDLCEKTGLSVEEIKNSIEFYYLLKRAYLKIIEPVEVPVAETAEEFIPILDEEIVFEQEFVKEELPSNLETSMKEETLVEVKEVPKVPHKGRPKGSSFFKKEK